MTTATDSLLLAFARARIADDKKLAETARDATRSSRYPTRAGSWEADGGYVTYGHPLENVMEPAGGDEFATVPHIAQHDPARVLLQCVALERLLSAAWGEMTRWKPGVAEEAWKHHVVDDCDDERCPCDVDRTISAFWATARDVASIWSGHPDYAPEWSWPWA